MSTILQSFIPWLLFFLLSGHSQSSVETATLTALISHLVLNRQMFQRGFVLDIGGLIFFASLAVNIYVFKNATITDNAYLLSNMAIALLAWLSLRYQASFYVAVCKTDGVTRHPKLATVYLHQLLINRTLGGVAFIDDLTQYHRAIYIG